MILIKQLYLSRSFVNDIVITTCVDSEGIKALKQHLFQNFQSKDSGPLRNFLKNEIAQLKLGIVISQRKFVFDILEETSLTCCHD